MEATSDQSEPKEVASYTVLAHLGQQLTNQYKPMIFAKWMRSLRGGNDYFKLIESHHYFGAYQKYITAVLLRRDCIVRTAVLSNDHDTCLGFSVSEPKVLHYVWVHQHNRKQGIARSLVPFCPEAITHLTKKGMSVWASKIPQALFKPFY